MTTGLEDAGFEIRDQLMWVFGSGFPKSHNIGKAVDKIMGNDREVVGEQTNIATRSDVIVGDRTDSGAGMYSGTNKSIPLTKGTSEWEGWGTALKPAHEPIVLARKPLSEKTNAENVIKWGTGGLNIDDSRIGTEQIKSPQHGKNTFNGDYEIEYNGEYKINEGRWPANIIFDEEAGQVLDQQSGDIKSTKFVGKGFSSDNSNEGWKRKSHTQTGERGYNDKGGASRFFYCPKASKKDRDEDNNHPTVKPTELMLYLIKLVTPVNGTVLDPFMGSGSTGKAAIRGGFDFVGIEKEEEYIKIAEARINNEKK
jgi:site-specific DNA-methyltransferase (adenine-specific)